MLAFEGIQIKTVIPNHIQIKMMIIDILNILQASR